MDLKNEKVLYDMKPDLRVAVLANSPLYIFVMFFMLIPIFAAVLPFVIALGANMLIFFLILTIPFLMLLITPLLTYLHAKSVSYSVTTARIIIRKGILARSEKSIPYKQIRNVELYKGVFDRLFNRSTLRFFSGETGTSHHSTTDAIAHIENGETVHGKILELIHN